jgi:hypothetical protein
MTQTQALHELLQPVGDCFDSETARKIVGIRAPDSVQNRMQRYASKSTEGTLTSEEQAEYEALVSAGTFIAILQSKARVVLQEASTS